MFCISKITLDPKKFPSAYSYLVENHRPTKDSKFEDNFRFEKCKKTKARQFLSRKQAGLFIKSHLDNIKCERGCKVSIVNIVKV